MKKPFLHLSSEPWPDLDQNGTDTSLGGLKEIINLQRQDSHITMKWLGRGRGVGAHV